MPGRKDPEPDPVLANISDMSLYHGSRYFDSFELRTKIAGSRKTPAKTVVFFINLVYTSVPFQIPTIFLTILWRKIETMTCCVDHRVVRIFFLFLLFQRLLAAPGASTNPVGEALSFGELESTSHVRRVSYHLSFHMQIQRGTRGTEGQQLHQFAFFS